MSVLHAIAEVVGTFWFGVRHYANWPTAISCGLLVAFVVSALAVTAVMRRKSRSSESRAGHGE